MTSLAEGGKVPAFKVPFVAVKMVNRKRKAIRGIVRVTAPLTSPPRPFFNSACNLRPFWRILPRSSTFNLFDDSKVDTSHSPELQVDPSTASGAVPLSATVIVHFAVLPAFNLIVHPAFNLSRMF
jgi:hypothetical protein